MTGTSRRRLACLALALSAWVAAAEGADESALSWGATVTVDTLRVGRPASSTALSHVDLRLDADAARLFAWRDTTLHVEAIADHGGKPNGRIGSLQGISNIEVRQSAVRLYSTWVERELRPGVRALVGLYDLNSEFYSTDASVQLVHPAFGIGSELGQTGRNGPSIFPTLSFGARLKAQDGSGFYAQGAVLDAVPGDPDHGGRTVVRLSRGEGALLALEAGWQERLTDGPASGHWGVGLWSYTRSAATIDGAGTARSAGAYGLAQGVLLDTPRSRTLGFVRAGMASRRVNAIDAAIDAGLLIDRPWGDVGPASVIAGIAAARLGREQRSVQALAGNPLRAVETALELGARWRLGHSLALQPLAQRVWNAAGRPGTATTIVGARWVWSPGDP
ncbi:MAG: carbohydrate porin [Caldimonas sp.]